MLRPAFFSVQSPTQSLSIRKSSNNPPVLEIGTFIGFSTLGWLDAVGPDGLVTALEFSPEYAKIAEETFAKNGIKNAEVIVGDARESWVSYSHLSLGI